jgi:acyl-CoA hydrolase
MVTAAVDGLEFLNPIKVGDFIVLKAHVTSTFTTSLEVEVTVFSEEALTGRRQMTSRAHLTFVTLARDGVRPQIPPLLLETDEEKRQQDAAEIRRAERLQRRARLGG